MDGDHRVAETIQLGLVFAFGRFDHQGAGHGPGERRRVKAVIHQPLRHVLGGHAFEVAQVENAFVRHNAVRAFVEHGEIFLQTARDVVRVEDGDLRASVSPSGPMSRM